MPLREDLLNPIPGDQPGGISLRYDPIYDRIKEARREELDVPQGGYQTTRKTADWPLVIKLTSETIATRSKDLQLGAWLTEASLRKDGFGGLREGLVILRRLIEEHWDHLHPEIEDGDLEMRVAPLEWIGRYLDAAVRMVPMNRAGHDFVAYRQSQALGYEADVASDYDRREAFKEAVAAGKLTADDFDAAVASTPKEWYRSLVSDIDGSLEELAALGQVADERFGPDAPNFGPLREVIQEVRPLAAQLFAEKLERDPDPVDVLVAEIVPDGTQGPDVGAGGTGAGGGVASGQSAVFAVHAAAAPSSLDEAGARIAAAARFVRAQDPKNPAAYLLLRGYRWGELRARGGEPDPELLVAPPTAMRSALKQQLLDEQWEELRESAEDLMATPYGRAWLDLQRFAVAACEGLGEGYSPVAEAIRSAIRSLLQDLPWLPSATLMDETPTCNAETLAWLRGEGLLGGAPEGDSAAGVPVPRIRLATRRDVASDAEAMVRARQPERAVEMLLSAAAAEQSERARFLRRLEAARILVDSGHEAVARPLLLEMEKQIERHELEQWEPRTVVAQPLALLYRCRQKLDSHPDLDDLFERISRLDPMAGLKLDHSSDG